MSVTIRDRADRCPGILRPWPAADGLLVRVRLIGGHATAAQLRGLVAAASAFGDGRIRPTTRANLQLRAFPGTDGVLDADALAAIEASGLLPAPTHDRVLKMHDHVLGLHLRVLEHVFDGPCGRARNLFAKVRFPLKRCACL